MNTRCCEARNSMVLRAESAADLMSPNLFSINEQATLQEAAAVLVDKGFHAAPVIDEAGRPVGVLSGTDILIHTRGTRCPDPCPTLVRDMMTPAVFSVGLHASPERVVKDMIALGIHQLFVVDGAGVLVGVITALDVARHLSAEPGVVDTAAAQPSLLLPEE